MNKTTEALKLAEEALVKANHFHDYEDALAAIREALAEPVKQEPVAWVNNESVQKLRECGWGDEAIATVVPTINLGAPVDAKAIQHCPCCGSDYFAGKTKVDLDTAVKSDPLYLQGRAEALEEAAKKLEGLTLAFPGRADLTVTQCAAAIRGLK